MARIDAILFDADGVIQRAPAGFVARLAATLGAGPDEAEACVAEVFAAEVPALVGERDYAETLAPVLARWRPSCDVAGVLELWREIDVDRSMLTLVAELRAAGVRCAVASNQQANRARHMSEGLGYRHAFDAEFYSCHLRAAKPSAEFFAAIIRQAGLDPARTLFLDDRLENVEAGRSAGLAAELFVLAEVGAGAAQLRPLLARYGL